MLNSHRNRLAVWLCNVILHHIATPDYKDTLNTVIREGLRRGR